MSRREAEVVKTGTWLYDGRIEKPVRILRQTWDHFRDEGYDDDPHDLNDEGYAYYAVYSAPEPPEPGQVCAAPQWATRSLTCLSLEAAVAEAERAVPPPIAWGRLPEIEDLDGYAGALLKKAGKRPYQVFELIHTWECFVVACEAGYGFDISEYDNELATRDSLAVLAADPTLRRHAGFEWFFRDIEALDARFKALLRQDAAIKDEDAPWWRRGVLSHAGADYARDIKSLHGIEIEVRER